MSAYNINLPLTLVGTIAEPPVLRTTSSNVKVCNFKVDVQEDFYDPKIGSYYPSRNKIRFSCVAWRSLAEAINANAGKGTEVTVVGFIRANNYRSADGVFIHKQQLQVKSFGICLKPDEKGTDDE